MAEDVRGGENVRDPYEACIRAAYLLRQVGFVHCYTSMKSEAAYYALPGRIGLLRVAAHSKDNGHGTAGKTVSRLTLPKATVQNISDEKFEMLVALAVGQYVMRARQADCVVVPREATDEMCDAATRSTSAWLNSKLQGVELRRLKLRIRWRAMIDVALATATAVSGQRGEDGIL